MATHHALPKGQSIDDMLLDGAVQNLSAEEVSARLKGALSPARVMQRTKELLQAADWLTDAEKERALLRVLEARVTELQRMSDLDSVKLQATLVKELLTQLNKRKDNLEEITGRLYQSQAIIMSQAIALAFERALFELQKRHPAIEVVELREVLAESLPEAVAVLSQHNSGVAIEA